MRHQLSNKYVIIYTKSTSKCPELGLRHEMSIEEAVSIMTYLLFTQNEAQTRVVSWNRVELLLAHFCGQCPASNNFNDILVP